MWRVTEIGYARVSTREQSPALQHDALAGAGCVKVFTDVASGAKADRPHLDAALAYLRPGDVLVVWQLDRLGRNMRHLIDTVNGLHERGVQFRSLRENIEADKIAVARQMYASKTFTVARIAATLGVTRGTVVYSHLDRAAA